MGRARNTSLLDLLNKANNLLNTSAKFCHKNSLNFLFKKSSEWSKKIPKFANKKILM